MRSPPAKTGIHPDTAHAAQKAVLEEAVSGKITWDAVEGVIDGDIGDTMIDFFETVYKNDSGGYDSCDLDRRNKEIYNTKTFARVIDLLIILIPLNIFNLYF